MDFQNKKVGICGFGVVGKTYLNYLSNFCHQILIYDQKDLNLNAKNIIQEKNLEKFLKESEYVFLSPGIKIEEYSFDKSKIVCELDLLHEYLQKNVFLKTIALTGTVGKTSIVTLINKIFEQQKKTKLCGNIGDPICNSFNIQNLDCLILELSSFQLNFSKKYSPDIAILANFSENHLDWHKTKEKYLNAKLNIFKAQKESQISLVPLEFKDLIESLNLKSKVYYFSDNDKIVFDNLLYIKNKDLFLHQDGKNILIFKNILDLDKTYLINYVIALSVCYLAGLNFESINFNFDLTIPHRLEKFLTFKGAEFYNDSKSTVSESTIYAVSKFKNKKICLILGGLSKGVDRNSMIAKIANKVEYVLIFGNEKEELKKYCDAASLKNSSFDNFESVVQFAFEILESFDLILFSPSGSSFDLFENYQHRGDVFKQLCLSEVKKYQKK